MKQLVWLLAIVTLLVGWRHYQSDRWECLALLLVVDIVSTLLLRHDLRKGGDYGNPGRELTRELGGQIGDEGKQALLKGIGLPEHLVEGYFMSKDARETGEKKIGLGSRILANVVWTFAIAGGSIYLLVKGFGK